MKIIFLLNFTLAYFSAIAQLGLDDFEFKGKVKSLNQFHYYYNNDTISSVNTHNNFYSVDGLLVKQISSHSYKDSLVYAVINNLYYDSLRRFVYSMTSDSSSITNVNYLNKGDTAKIITYLSYSKGKLSNEKIIKFNHKNQKILKINLDYTINKFEQEYYRYKQFKKDRLKEFYTYNALADRLIRFYRTYKSEDGTRVEGKSEDYISGDKSTSISIYNANKDLISFTISFNNSNPYTTTYEYSNFDKNGN